MANKYQLQSRPEATLDGTGMVAHDIQAVTAEDVPIPGRHATILVPEDALEAVMNMPHSNASERQAKNTAYKNLIAAHLPGGWTDTELQDIVEQNSDASNTADLSDKYITEVLNQDYPIGFTI